MRRNRLDGHLHEAGIQSSILGNTEHFSITDTLGFSVSATISNGASSGIFCEKSGILFNNILGEPDLNPNGFMVGTPGQRFPSGMAPTFIKKDGEIIYILGSSGSDRIRTSLVNIIVNLIIDELTIEEAIEKGRVHYDGRNLYLEC